MEDAHYYTLPTQGNIYSMVTLPLSSGGNKILISTLRRKIYSCEYLNEDGVLVPFIKEIPFTYIPSGAEIISIDAFNRATEFDDFFIGITIIKVNGDQNAETYLNIYTEQELDEGAVLNLDSLAQNCLMVELPFTPYHLYHTQLFTSDKSSEIVWLLSGSDLKVHLFREDPQNHTYCETEIDEVFPEFGALSSVVIWMDIKYTSSKQRRITGFGCECGLIKLHVIDVIRNSILENYSVQYDAPISRVLLFPLENHPTSSDTVSDKNEDHEISNLNLVAVSTLQPSVVYMDILNCGFRERLFLPESEKHDAVVCGCVADINFNMTNEILLGTFARTLLVYSYSHHNNSWILTSSKNLSHSVQAIAYIDITGDGLKELTLLTMTGIHIFQHNLNAVARTFEKRSRKLTCETGKVTQGHLKKEAEN